MQGAFFGVLPCFLYENYGTIDNDRAGHPPVGTLRFVQVALWATMLRVIVDLVLVAKSHSSLLSS